MTAIMDPRRRGAAALLLMISATLGGCHDANQSIADWASREGMPIQDWGRVRPTPEPRAVPTDYRHDVAFDAARTDIPKAEADRLKAFLRDLGVSRDDQVFVARAVAAEPMADRRREMVASWLALQGVTVVAAPTDIKLDPRPDDGVAVVVRRYTVALPPCPDWSGMPNDNFSNRPGSNFGCATALNFGVMVASPQELVRGRPLEAADGTVMARAVDRYRRGKTKDLIRDAASAEIFPSESSEDSSSEE